MTFIQRRQLIALAALFVLAIAVSYRIDNHTDWLSVSLQLIDMSSQVSTRLTGVNPAVRLHIDISDMVNIKLLF
ncbi:hypothetical protein H5123_09560 [Shewanella sp. SR43-4]|jgi:hypothetical protein|uniref:hypothetical protein n=1 Tax=Shewanella TaxID=22 RepID=UPI000C607496|nr:MULTISPECIES: hypothetical protein [Shewanella]NCQ46293.1 hypothetical protein [Shewanella frigidimarina]MBB1317885.1 hypothetical protein [Shewanella sp. SR43-4]NCO72793.1 hypothetical protein [Shewanella vesiculosa]NCP37905.1 hypothetical protein [Shewanella vesiculosa]NCP70217.1 hypothetical protein [Shewanella vesiculosa]|tara:strand:- start:4090 stop:4311 length:222 start_codon:yes stop_codon:yes gene_type:complete